MEGEEVVEDAGSVVEVTAGEGADADAPAGSGEDASTAPEPASPEFDWAAWDGSEEALPEEARFWATGVQTHVSKAYEQRIAEAERARQTYDAILQGMEDPRLQELEEKVASGEATMAETRQALQAKEEAFAALEAAHTELIDTQARAEVEAFKSAFEEVLKDPGNRERLNALMDDSDFSDSTLEELGQLVTMGEEDLAAVRQVMAEEKVSTRFAIRFVTATKAQAAPTDQAAPRPAAPQNPAKSIVAGASKGGRPAKAISGSNKKKPANLEEAKLRTAQKYFR